MASNSDAPYLSGLVETMGKMALAKTLEAVTGGKGGADDWEGDRVLEGGIGRGSR